jgi:polysaccharide pyruvyl transferase WcaK-like protein
MNVVETADLVFSARDVDHESARTLLREVGHEPFALVNASGLIGRSVSQAQEYHDVITHLRQRGMRVVLLPHVSRSGGDDISICRELHQRLADPAVTLIDHLPDPAVVRGLTARATLVITGRMHLAIMSLFNGVPAITLATQDKVEGLMQLFHTESLCIEPSSGFGQRINRVVDDLLQQLDAVKATIRSHLPLVRQRSSLNFESLRAG